MKISLIKILFCEVRSACVSLLITLRGDFSEKWLKEGLNFDIQMFYIRFNTLHYNINQRNKMKIILFLPLIMLLVGCVNVNQVIDTTALVPEKKDTSFHTDLQRFEDELNSIKTKEQRNKVIDQLITASNMECSAHQYKTTNESEEETSGVYAYMFKSVGKYIGLDIAKDAIDAVSAL